MIARVIRITDLRLVRYVLASVGALAVDMGSFLRTRQKTLFVGSAMIGLALTIAIVGIADLGGLDPRLAKLAAIAVSFTVAWMLRSKIVFRAVPVA